MIITGAGIFNAEIRFPDDFRRGLAAGCGEMKGGFRDAGGAKHTRKYATTGAGASKWTKTLMSMWVWRWIIFFWVL